MRGVHSKRPMLKLLETIIPAISTHAPSWCRLPWKTEYRVSGAGVRVRLSLTPIKIAPAKNGCSVLSFFGHIIHHTAALREKVSADDELRNSALGKNVANFYSRTAHIWNKEAAKLAGELAADQVELITATKELKREGFCLAGLKGYSCSARRKGRRRRPRRSQKISLFGWQGQGRGRRRYWARARAISG